VHARYGEVLVIVDLVPGGVKKSVDEERLRHRVEKAATSGIFLKWRPLTGRS